MGRLATLFPSTNSGCYYDSKKKDLGHPNQLFACAGFMSKKPDMSGRVQEGRYTQLISGLDDATLYYYASKILLRSTYNYLAF
jgi:hypothetical protein